MMAAAEPSLTPEQSKMPSAPATRGEQAIVSLETSLRNCARGFSAPFLWFFQAMRVITSLNWASSTPNFLAYAGARSLKAGGAVSAARVPSTSRSLAPLSQCSPNGVQPIPTIATRSRMPLLAMQWSRFPEVVVDAAGGDDAAEGHGHAVADLDGLGIDVGHLGLEPAAALEVEHRDDHRRGPGISQPIDGGGRDGGPDVGPPLRPHLVGGVALYAHALPRAMPRATGPA